MLRILAFIFNFYFAKALSNFFACINNAQKPVSAIFVAFFTSLLVQEKFHAPQFCKRNFGHDFLPFRENVEGLPVLEISENAAKKIYNLGDHVLTGSCSHTRYLLHLVSLSFGRSSSGCYSMAQEVSRSSSAENEELL